MGRCDEIRRKFKENDDKRDAGLITPDSIIRYDDICYGCDSKWQILDVYRPKDVEGTIPVIISVHGGGWVYGDKERYQYYCMELAKEGFAVVNFTYRLAPEYKFPSPIEDTALVFEWVIANAEQYGMDIKNVFAVGDSAGAHILGMYMALLTNQEYEKILGEEYDLSLSHKITTMRQYGSNIASSKDNLVVKAIGLNCGIYKPDYNDELMYDYLEEHGSDKEYELVDITRYITKDFPDSYIMTCSGDFLISQPIHLAQMFNEIKIPFLYKVYGDANNLLPHVFHCDIRTKYAKICNKEQCDYFKSFVSEEY